MSEVILLQFNQKMLRCWIKTVHPIGRCKLIYTHSGTTEQYFVLSTKLIQSCNLCSSPERQGDGISNRTSRSFQEAAAPGDSRCFRHRHHAFSNFPDVANQVAIRIWPRALQWTVPRLTKVVRTRWAWRWISYQPQQANFWLSVPSRVRTVLCSHPPHATWLWRESRSIARELVSSWLKLKV